MSVSLWGSKPLGGICVLCVCACLSMNKPVGIHAACMHRCVLASICVHTSVHFPVCIPMCIHAYFVSLVYLSMQVQCFSVWRGAK